MAGVMPTARALGEKLDCQPIPELEPIQTHTFHLTNWRAWGFPSKAAMDEAFYGDDHD